MFAAIALFHMHHLPAQMGSGGEKTLTTFFLNFFPLHTPLARCHTDRLTPAGRNMVGQPAISGYMGILTPL